MERRAVDRRDGYLSVSEESEQEDGRETSWDNRPLPLAEEEFEAIPLKPVGRSEAVSDEGTQQHGDCPPGPETSSMRARKKRFRKWLRLPDSPWVASYGMYLFFVAGVAFAIGHHCFYASLDGQIVDDQLRMTRWGTALAFASKACLTASVACAFEQEVWATVRTRFLTVGALDSMFAAREDPTELLNWEFMSKARVALGLAVFGWIAPAVVIVSPSTLLVEPSFMTQDTFCPGVRTLNFDFEGSFERRFPRGRQKSLLDSLSLATWNETREDEDDPLDYYNKPSDEAARSAFAAAILNGPISKSSDALETCERGWNCTVEVDMVGPGYNCTELASGYDGVVASLTQQSGDADPPWPTTNSIVPAGTYAYRARASGGDYMAEQLSSLDLDQWGRPKPGRPLPKHLGAFRTEPVVWIAYADSLDESRRPFMYNDSTKEDFANAMVPKVIACEHYETRYRVQYRFTDGAQSIVVKNRTFLAPVVNTTYTPDKKASNDTLDETTATPLNNYVLLANTPHYKKTAAYHALGSLFRSYLEGSIQIPFDEARASVMQTKLIDQRDFHPRENFKELVPSLYEDMIFSLLYNPRWVSVAWAASPDIQVGPGGKPPSNTSEYLYPCTRSRPTNRYRYSVQTLWAIYGGAILLALLGLEVGTIALWQNGGHRRDARFSSLLAATRGRTLDRIDWRGPAVDEGEVNDAVKGVKLSYGRTRGDGGEATMPGRASWGVGQPLFTFGCEGDVDPVGRHRV
ncbi:hypothetical protein ACJ41O_009358 [Fusarium nematophilum]